MQAWAIVDIETKKIIKGYIEDLLIFREKEAAEKYVRRSEEVREVEIFFKKS